MIEQFGNSPPSSSGAVITNRPGIHHGWKNASRTGIKTLIATSRKSRGYACRRYLPHCASFSAVEEHYWAGWYFGTVRDLLAPAKTGIITEFGAQALPRLSTLKPLSRHHICGLKRPPPTTPAGRSGNTIIFSRSRPLSLRHRARQ